MFVHDKCRKFEDNFIKEKKYSILKVPSAVVKGDFNCLLNPYHVDFKKVEIINFHKFPFDKRLFPNTDQ